MAITYPLSHPTANRPNRVTMRMKNKSVVMRSPFTYVMQAIKHQGMWWEAEVGLPPMNRETAQPWIAFLNMLNGKEGTFLMGDPSCRLPRGSAGATPGTPIVSGAAQLGPDLNVEGLPFSTTGYLLAGDYIQLGTGLTSRLFMVLEDVNSDAFGDSTITVWPEFNRSNSPANGAAITVTDAKGLWRLVTNEPSWTGEPFNYGVSFACRSIP